MFGIFYRLKSIKLTYSSKSPLEKWYSVRQLNYYLLKVVGVHFMDPNYKVDITTLVPIYIAFNYYALMIYTCCYYRHNLYRALISTPALGTFVPVRVI